MTEDTMDKQVFVCDGCLSWTDRPVTRDEAISEYHWVEGDEPQWDGETLKPLYCPECE
jgi:hypothetical protein